MAEAIALGASIIAVIQIADRVVGLCKFYIETARDAPSDLRTIFVETSALKTTLESLEYLDKHDSANSAIAKSICGPNGPIKGCLQTLAALEKLFPDIESRLTNQKRNKRMKLDYILTSLAWPLKETKARKLLDELVRYKTTINLALTTGIAQDVRCIKEETSKIHEMITESQSREVYTWLQHTDPSPLHHRARKNHEPGTSAWICKTTEWTEWLDRKHRAIHVHGIPGAGKTVLMSYVIEQIEKQCQQSAGRNRVYVYYYCYFGHKQDETRPFLKWLIGRLCREAGGVPRYVSDLSRRGMEPSIADFLEAAAQLLCLFETVFVAIDAIDESEIYHELLEVLQILATDPKFSRLQIVTSSRQYPDIERVMRSISQLISMSNPFVEQDIRQHVHSTLQSNVHFHSWPQDLLKEVEGSLACGASGMFRWAVCQIDIIRRLKSERMVIQKALKTLPKTLYETYDRIVQTVSEEDRIFVYYALQWIALNNEVCTDIAMPYVALIGAAEASMLRLTGIQNERHYDKDTLADVCGCLINIGSVKSFSVFPRGDYILDDHNDGVVFAHYSVQEYLNSRPDLNSIFGHHTLIGGDLRIHLLTIALTESQQLDEEKLSMILSGIPERELISKDRLGANMGMALAAGFCCNDFRIHSVLLASSSLYRLCDHVWHNEALKVLAIDFLDPSRPRYPVVEKLMTAVDLDDTDLMEDHIECFFWKIKWDPKTKNDTKHLYNLIFVARDRQERFSLAQSFLGTKDRKRLLQVQVRFIVGIVDENRGSQDYLFNGSCVEIFAQLAAFWLNNFDFLMELSVGLFNPSVVLAQYLGALVMDLSRVYGKHPVQRLLELGADPSLPIYKTTPLQIACLAGDLVAVKELLRAGAKPNDMGTPDGVPWEVGSFMYENLSLHGASPLSICRSFFNARYEWSADSGNMSGVEELLLSHGAEESVLSSCEAFFEDNCWDCGG